MPLADVRPGQATGTSVSDVVMTVIDDALPPSTRSPPTRPLVAFMPDMSLREKSGGGRWPWRSRVSAELVPMGAQGESRWYLKINAATTRAGKGAA